MNNKLIVIEGACDGIGKSTQFKLLSEKLTKDGKDIVTHKFPTYGKPQVGAVEEYLRGNLGRPEDLINTAYAINRA